MIRTVFILLCACLGLLLTGPVVFLALPFLLVNGMTCGIARFLQPKAVSWKKLIEFEPTIGWKPKPNLDTNARSDKVFHVTTDQDGWRGKSSVRDSQVIVFGDSFAFGDGVSDHAFFADVNSSPRVKAIGANGYDMVQGLLWMRRLSNQLQDKLVVWWIYHGNDLYENLQPNLDEYRMPFVRESKVGKSWEIVTNHVSDRPWNATSNRRYYERLAEICSPTFLSERVYSACDFLIGRGHDVCRQAGADLLVMSVPDLSQISPSHIANLASLSPEPTAFDPELPDRRIREICQKRQVPFVPLKDHLNANDYKRDDCHWNELGHRRVAQILRDLHRQHASPSALEDPLEELIPIATQ